MLSFFQNIRFGIVPVVLSVLIQGGMFLSSWDVRFAASHRLVPITDEKLISLCKDFQNAEFGPEKEEIGAEIARRESIFIHTNKPYCHRLKDLFQRLGPAPHWVDGDQVIHIITDDRCDIVCWTHNGVIYEIRAGSFDLFGPPDMPSPLEIYPMEYVGT